MRIPRDPYVENIILKIDMAACSVVVVKKISQHILIYIIWKNKALEGGGVSGCPSHFFGKIHFEHRAPPRISILSHARKTLNNTFFEVYGAGCGPKLKY